MTGLVARELGFSRGPRPVFAGLGFTVRPGGLLQVRGANGSGKSTLLRVLCGLLTPETGDVRWEGRTVRAGDPAFARDVAYVGHADGLAAELGVAANLRCAARLHGMGDGEVRAALRAFELEALADVAVRRLSQGQRRRVALARLGLGRRRLWVLDEPAVSLDEAAAARFHGMLAEHLGRGGTAVVATHEGLPTGGDILRLGTA